MPLPFYPIHDSGGGLCGAADQAECPAGKIPLYGDRSAGHRIDFYRAGDVQQTGEKGTKNRRVRRCGAADRCVWRRDLVSDRHIGFYRQYHTDKTGNRGLLCGRTAGGALGERQRHQRTDGRHLYDERFALFGGEGQAAGAGRSGVCL